MAELAGSEPESRKELREKLDEYEARLQTNMEAMGFTTADIRNMTLEEYATYRNALLGRPADLECYFCGFKVATLAERKAHEEECDG